MSGNAATGRAVSLTTSYDQLVCESACEVHAASVLSVLMWASVLSWACSGPSGCQHLSCVIGKLLLHATRRCVGVCVHARA